MNEPTLPPDSVDPQATPGIPVEPGRVVGALWRMRWILVLAFVLGAGGGVVAAKVLLPPIYRSMAVVRYDAPSPLPGIAQAEGTALSQVESAFVADQVLSATKEALDIELPLRVLRLQVGTSSNAKSDTVAVSFNSSSPEKAKRTVEKLIEEAARYSQEQRRADIRAAIERYESREAKQARDVEQLRERYKAFRKEHGIADLSTEQQAGLRGAASLRAERDMKEAEIKALEAQVRQLELQVKSAPALEVASAAVSNPDMERLAALEAELASARSSLSGEHPRVKALELQVDNLRVRVNSGETKSVSRSTMTRSATRSAAQTSLTSLKSDLLAAKEQYTSLSALAEEAQAKLKRYGAIEGQAVSFMSQLEVSESLLKEMRSAKAQLTSALHAPESNFSVIDPAQEPEAPEANASRKKLALAVPAALLFLVALIAIVREFWGARILTPAELAYWGKGPVLAASTWPRDETAFDELVADFDDCAPYARGETLLVASSPSLLEATGELARRLHGEWFENAVIVQGAVSAELPRTRALASGDQRGSQGRTIELWRSPAENETQEQPGYAGARPLGSAPPPAMGRVVAWSGGMDGHGLRRAARLADRVVVLVEMGALNPLTLRDVRAAIARDEGVGFILVSARESVSQGRDRVGAVREFWEMRVA